jgi:hypothetical protein
MSYRLLLSKGAEDKPIDLKKLQFGSAIAENDTFLSESYVDNAGLESLIYSRANIITGQKGSGKSAIVRIISQINKYEVKSNNHENLAAYIDELKDKIIIELNQSHNLDVYKFLLKQKEGSKDPEKFKMLWLCYMATLIGKRIIENADYNYTEPNDLKKLKRLLKPFHVDNESSDLNEVIINYIKKCDFRVKLGFKGFEAELSHKDTQSDRVIDLNLFELLKLENQMVSNWDKFVWVLVDRIDDFYKYNVAKMQQLVQGLFLALEELRFFSAIEAIVLIRSDIYERAEVKDADKFRESKFEISWDCQQTQRFVAKRLLHDKQMSSLIRYTTLDDTLVNLALALFFPSHIEHSQQDATTEKVAFSKWFTRHLENGKGYISPRDIIVFLKKCVNFELQDNGNQTQFKTPIVSESSVKKAYQEISKERFQDVRDLTGFEDLLNTIQDGRHRKFSYDKLKTALKGDEELTGQLNAMESLGFLKRKETKAKKNLFRYVYEVPPLYTGNW